MPRTTAPEFRAHRHGEIPPTAGLPLRLGDLLPRTSSLTERAAEFIGLPRLELECSGTASFVLALSALHRLTGRRSVIVPAYTCPLVALAISRCGLKLVSCEQLAGSFEMDPDALNAVCSSDTLAVVPTHIAGRVADTHAIRSIAHRHGAFLIEDAAQAFGARADNKTVGAEADLAFFSLAVGKGLSTFEGGLWFARDPALHTAALVERDALIKSDFAFELWRCLQLLGYAALYRPLPLRAVYGRPLRQALAQGDVAEAIGDVFDTDIPLHTMSGWRQGVGARALTRLADFQRALKTQASQRLPALRALPGVTVLDDAPGCEGAWPTLFVLLPTQAARDAALELLWRARLGVSRLFAQTLGDYDYLSSIVPRADTPAARDFAARSLTISNSLWLDDERFDYIVRTLRTVLTQS